jgi:hypothetical protein
MFNLQISDYISELVQVLKNHNIEFVVSKEALGCDITEVYVTEAHELLVFPNNQLDTDSIQWILRLRTPLKVRITFFSNDISKLKIRLLDAIDELKKDGLDIPHLQQAISIQELTKENIQRISDSLVNWSNLTSTTRPLPQMQTSRISSKTKEEDLHLIIQKQEDIHSHLRNAIKSYWTERYFARYMNLPSQKLKALAKRLGIQREVCGHDTLYFFNREKALEKYFIHITKAVLDELNLKYKETSTQAFFLPDLQLTLHLFDGEKEHLRILAGESAQNRDLIVIAPDTLRRRLGVKQDDLFQILPLDKDKIKNALMRIARQRIDYIPAYSSGITN